VLNFRNNFAKCKLIVKIFHRWKKVKDSNKTCAENFDHTLNVLLNYLVKYNSRYYCTANSKFNAVPNDQQTLLQFIDILNTQLEDTLLTMPQIAYRSISGLFDMVI